MARRFNRNMKRNSAKSRTKKYFTRDMRQHITYNEKSKPAVLNLSKITLNDSENKLLTKGLKFIPCPRTSYVKRDIMADFNEFARKLRCKYHFYRKNDRQIHPFRENTGFEPDKACPALESYIDKTKLELSSIYIRKYRPNMTNSETRALHNLKQNNGIVIKKADKSKTFVIMDKDKYVEEGLRQLHSKHYIETTYPDTDSLKQKVQSKIHEMHRKGTIDKETLRYLTCASKVARIGQCYLLPKIHKFNGCTLDKIARGELENIPNPPGRPIISQIGTVTEKIGHYCDHFLKPLVRAQSTYIEDTSEFIRSIETVSFDRNCLLVSYDISNMFTNLAFDELLIAVRSAYAPTFIQGHVDIKCPDVEDIIFLLQLVLENNYFTFDNKVYKQRLGVAMGAAPSPEICDIRMFEITQDIINNKYQHKNKIKHHVRFRDDGMMVFYATRNEVEEFFRIGNSIHEHLKFTYEISESHIVF